MLFKVGFFEDVSNVTVYIGWLSFLAPGPILEGFDGAIAVNWGL